MNHPPNIVLIMTDQQRADFFRSEGFALDTMPFTEAFGARGVRFRHAYTPMPVCVPARSSTLTGRFPKATRVRENSAAEHMFRPPNVVETDALTWIALASGRRSWRDAVESGALSASGERSDLSERLPLL